MTEQPKKPLPPPDVLEAEIKAVVGDRFPGALTEDMAQDVQDVVLAHVAQYDIPPHTKFSEWVEAWRFEKGLAW